MNRPFILSTVVTAIGAFFAGRYFPSAPEPAGKSNPLPAIAGTSTDQAKPSRAPAIPASDAVSPVKDQKTPKAIASAEKLMEMLERLVGSWDAGAMDGILLKWLAADPEGAFAFLSTSAQRDALLQKFTANWAKMDPAAASAWVAAHPDQTGRDAMAAGLAAGVCKEDPQAAVKWVASIKDPVLKLDAAQRSGYEFYRQSDAAAQEAFAGMGLPESSREHVQGAWAAQLHSVSRRNAQNLASTFNAAQAAGAAIDPGNLDALRSLMAEGVKGSGQFSNSVFKLDSKDLTEREIITAQTHLELSGNDLKYKKD